MLALVSSNTAANCLFVIDAGDDQSRVSITISGYNLQANDAVVFLDGNYSLSTVTFGSLLASFIGSASFPPNSSAAALT